jgi:hypothetical protein
MWTGYFSHLVNHSNQVSIIQGGLTDFFLSINSSKETTKSKIKREFLSQVRKNLKKKRLEVQA